MLVCVVPVSLMLAGMFCALSPCEVKIALLNPVAMALEAGNVKKPLSLTMFLATEV